MKRLIASLLISLLVGLLLVGPAAAQSAAWLDAPPQAWNGPGATVPSAPAVTLASPPTCAQQERGPTTPDEEVVARTGWKLLQHWTTARAGDLEVVFATAGYDGMCRPAGFQGFAFVGGRFAGTIAPEAMVSREDGALTAWSENSLVRFADGKLEAQFIRYAPSDPRCCPSRGHAHVLYRVDSDARGPVLVPDAITAVPPVTDAAAPAPTQLPRTGGIEPTWLAALGVLALVGGLALRRIGSAGGR